MVEHPDSHVSSSPERDQDLLVVRGLTKTYTSSGRVVQAVQDVSFAITKGETLGIVGESGSGKSTTGKCVLRLTTPTAGEVWLGGTNLAELTTRQLRSFRKRMQAIFQDPFASLNPRMTVLECVREPLYVHQVGDAKEQIQRAIKLLDTVGIAERNLTKRPSEFSGGQLQRVGIARALALNPELIVCDEPVSALDVSIQAQVLNLLKDLQDEFSLTYLFISHDLSVIRNICDNVCVMRNGRIVESGATGKVLSRPTHDYTRSLISAALLNQ